MNDVWKARRVLVTGGASFIGSHLVDALVERGTSVRVVDDLSSGSIEHIRGHLADRAIELVEADLHEPGVARRAVEGMEVVFHLAADHGGRGYVDTCQAGPAANLALDGLRLSRGTQSGRREGRLRFVWLRLPQLTCRPTPPRSST